MDKDKRQETLLTLVRDGSIANQRQIVDLMRKSGFSVTQASISRDIRELGLVKLAGRYLPRDELPALPQGVEPHGPVLGLITKYEPVGANLIVIHTGVGAASSVGVALDEKKLSEVVGTVAGDDTLFVAVRSRSDQGRLMARLSGWAGPAKPRPARTGGEE